MADNVVDEVEADGQDAPGDLPALGHRPELRCVVGERLPVEQVVRQDVRVNVHAASPTRFARGYAGQEASQHKSSGLPSTV